MSILDECKIHLEGGGQFGMKQEKWRDVFTSVYLTFKERDGSFKPFTIH